VLKRGLTGSGPEKPGSGPIGPTGLLTRGYQPSLSETSRTSPSSAFPSSVAGSKRFG